MQLSDLENRMVVELRNGGRYFVVGEYLINATSYTQFSSYTNNLLYVKRYASDLDIVKVFDKITAFKDITSNTLDILWEETNYTYPMWFKTRYFDDKYIIVKFTSLQEGTVVKSVNLNTCVGHFSENFVPHTNLYVWTQIPEPIEELTLEQVCQELGRKVKIIS